MRPIWIRAQGLIPTKLPDLSGIPVVNSWEGLGFLILAVLVIVRRKRLESIIGMDETTHASALESQKKIEDQQLKSLETKDMEIKRLNEQLMGQHRQGHDQVVAERDALRAQLDKEKADHLTTFRDKVKFELEAADLTRVREERDNLSELLKAALNSMDDSDGLSEESENIKDQMDRVTSEASNPSIRPSRKKHNTSPGKKGHP
jgi:hypothetical protein